MLTERRITITAKTVIDDVAIANHGALLNLETNDLSFYGGQLDKDACKEHRDILRADKAAFEDFAYHIQEEVTRN